jgi:uncharacterized membrane protein HdeD (DUF308 family)
MDKTRLLFFISGLIALFFGVLAVGMPSTVLTSLIVVLGVVLVVLGIITAYIGISGEQGIARGALIACGVISFIVGLILLASPVIATVIIGWVIAFWVLVMAVTSISRAIAYKWVTHRVLLAFIGIIGILVAIFVIFNPVGGTVVLMWVVGIYFIIIGLVSIAESLFLWKKAG